VLKPEMRDILTAERVERQNWPKDLPGQRTAALERALAMRSPLLDQVDLADIKLDARHHSVPLRVITPKTPVPKPMILFIHGGAFIAGSPQQSSPVAEQLAILTGSVVVSVGYRLAPEHPFPSGLEDCTAALQWLDANSSFLNGNRHQICVVGVSAGANLAVGAIRNAGVRVCASALIYGVFGTRVNTGSYRKFGGGEFGLSTARMESAFDLYFPLNVDREAPDAAPLNADLTGFPPTCLIAAQCDPLRDDSDQFHKNLLAAKVRSSFHEFRGMAHGFINHFDSLPEATRAMQTIAEHFSRHYSDA